MVLVHIGGDYDGDKETTKDSGSEANDEELDSDGDGIDVADGDGVQLR